LYHILGFSSIGKFESTLGPSFLKKEGGIGPPLLDKRGVRGDFELRGWEIEQSTSH